MSFKPIRQRQLSFSPPTLNTQLPLLNVLEEEDDDDDAENADEKKEESPAVNGIDCSN